MRGADTKVADSRSGSATEDEHGDHVRQAIADLRYGGVAVNVWPAAIYALASPSWGAYPGHPPEDIQSGAGGTDFPLVIVREATNDYLGVHRWRSPTSASRSTSDHDLIFHSK